MEINKICPNCKTVMLCYDDFHETFSHSEYDETIPHHLYCPKCGKRINLKRNKGK